MTICRWCASTHWTPAAIGGGWFCNQCHRPHPRNPGVPFPTYLANQLRKALHRT